MTTPLVAAALVVVVLTLVALARRRRDPLARHYAAFAAHRGWQRTRAEAALEILASFPEYTEGGMVVDAVDGALGTGRGMLASIAPRRAPAEGRPWSVAVALNGGLDGAPSIDMDPRAVRTVRVVDVVREVQVDESRLGRGWRITSPDHDAAQTWLAHPQRRFELAEALHRPQPWVYGVRIRPGAVAVHLSRRDEQPADVDDLQRLSALASDIAAALEVRAR